MNHDPRPFRKLEFRGPATELGRRDGLEDLARRYRDRQTCLRVGLDENRAELEQAMFDGWMCCVKGHVLPPGLQSRCTQLHRTVEALERELARIGAALHGVETELTALSQARAG